MAELTFWLSPYTSLKTIQEAVDAVNAHTPDGWHGNLLIPSNYGTNSQGYYGRPAPELRISTVDDVARIQAALQPSGLGFGVWGAPVTADAGGISATYGVAAGYYASNIEGTPDFWAPGDDAEAIVEFWNGYWAAPGAADVLNGNTGVTIVPNGEMMGWSQDSFDELAAGANYVLLEVYGGPNTSSTYRYPNLWPTPSFTAVQTRLPNSTLVPILALANLTAQLDEADALSPGDVHVWSL